MRGTPRSEDRWTFFNSPLQYYIYQWLSSISCGLARQRNIVGEKPNRVVVA